MSETFFLQIAQITGTFFRDENLVFNCLVRFNAQHLGQLDMIVVVNLLAEEYGKLSDCQQ